MSMAASIENRVPFVTPEVYRFGINLPMSKRVTCFKRKVLLHQTLNNYFPNKYSHRPKIGFGVPINKWFNSDAGRERLNSLLNSNNKLYSIVDKEAVYAFVKNNDGSLLASETLWILLTLSIWLDIFLGGKVADYSPA
ncbi:MAG: hypothetical protein C0392_07010 [Syntrophus sp. (in: bacteria)]|nr:hypothetical protein [Syntrophus sp. (in: bacteria)]